MNVTRTAIAALLLVPLAAAPAGADVFVLKGGRRIEGSVVRETAKLVVVQTGLGEIEIKKTDIIERKVGKTARQEFDEKWKVAETADDFHALGDWAQKKKVRSLALKAWKRAVELEPDHEGAHKALGHVRYKGEWMKPKERDKRREADEKAAMNDRGLVEYEGRWVTPKEKANLEQGLVLYEGRWMEEAAMMRLKGFELFEGRWLPRHEQIARTNVRAVEAILGFELETLVTSEAAFAGPWPAAVLQEHGEAVDVARAWFNGAYDVEPGLGLLGGRLAEFYAWDRKNAPFEDTVDHFGALTTTTPEGWEESARGTHGFYWVDPYCCSSARVWHRPDADLLGHNVHHWGHMMVNRLGYDGKLLPPWYDEALASLTEFRVREKNAVFCRADREVSTATGTDARTNVGRFAFDPAGFRDGGWRRILKEGLEAGAITSFDTMAKKRFSQLELIDIATGMAVLEWLEALGPTALRAFHDDLRRSRPKPPLRLIELPRERHAAYDAAFQAAADLDWRSADRAWREWFLSL